MQKENKNKKTQALSKKEIKKTFKKFKRKQEIFLLLENIQYATNVASIFRTADAAGVRRIILTGISHKPPFGKDLSKTSRHKEKSVQWEFHKTSGKILNTLKKNGFIVVSLELTNNSVDLYSLPYKLAGRDKVCIVVGNEVHGVSKSTLEKSDLSVHIPMFGKGASLNVGVAAGILLFGF
ncbi:MAG: TrmH family RNA methyltransferase [Candidatus Dojkabacteria bacterium]